MPPVTFQRPLSGWKVARLALASALRTSIAKPSGAPPRAILILVPGFLGGAGNFTPLAEQLVRERTEAGVTA